MNITKGLKVEDFVAQTFCDFGDHRRKVEIGKHYDYSTAKRAYKRIADIYLGQRDNCRVWQETRSGTILNDSAT